LSLARRLLSYAPALERMLLSVVVSGSICVEDMMTEKEIAVKERTLKECLKETWYQTDIKTYNDLNGSKQRERKGYRCAETMDLPRVLYDGEGFLFYMLSSERAAT
jgi:hypothetical protein